MPRGLAQKLILSLTIIVVVISTAFGVISLKAQERQLLNAMILGADQLSKAITSATWHAMLADNKQSAYEVMETIALKQGIERIRMYNREGRVMFSTRDGEVSLQVDRSAKECSICHARPRPSERVDAPSRVRINTAADGHRALVMVTPIHNEPSCSEAACHAHPTDRKVLGVLDLTLNLDPVDRELAGIKVRVLATAAIQVVLIAAFIAYLTRRFLSRPIRDLVTATKKVSEMDLDQTVEISRGSEEIRELASSFELMRIRLKQALGELNQSALDLEKKVEERTQQLKAAHQKLMQSDRLASLGQLSASVAHEINNPIGSVLNLGMLMQRILKDDGIPSDRITEFRRYLGLIVEQTTRVGRIVSDLLAFSRRSKPQRTNADLRKVVDSTLALISHKLKLASVEVEVSVDEDLPPVFCDAPQVQQVILTLLINATEAIQSRGAAGVVKIGLHKTGDGQSVLVNVSDNGEGIREENLPKIFDPFFTTKPEGKGVGLGLAVLYGIVQAHGGDVAVSSRSGEGTTFTLTFPVSPGSNSEVVLPSGGFRAGAA